jgi:hypothetical protein
MNSLCKNIPYSKAGLAEVIHSHSHPTLGPGFFRWATSLEA